MAKASVRQPGPTARVLLVDDDVETAEALREMFAASAYAVDVASSAEQAIERFRDETYSVVLADLQLPGESGLDLVKRLRREAPATAVVVMTGHASVQTAVSALKLGAVDYLVKPVNPAQLRQLVEKLAKESPAYLPNALLAAEQPGDEVFEGMLARSPKMHEIFEQIRLVAATEATVLIIGETGTGKELVARAIHGLGRRTGGPFVPLNCAAIPEPLAESEFFGHARGAFTGALQERPGALRLADRGTLFLDEVEDLPLALQAKLLRVVQDREVRPLGGTAARRVDVRIVAAANRDLGRMVEAGEFRRDLYYRLRVLAIALPPLRQRREDVPALVAHFIGRYNRRHGTTFAVPPPPVLRPLLEHTWPGNVRELENTLESLLTLASASGLDLARVLRERPTLGASLWADERTRILRVLEEHRWNRQRAAAALGISRVTLWRRMERHGIRDPLGAPVRETA